ncbi:MAG: glycosyltransferase family 2 protein [Acidobacteria bacterium]|nr:glycosyltransferase family 2 protein [Acidobacteriota bacterium]
MPRVHSKSSISIFFPAFNDQETIGELVADAFALLPTLTDDYEVLVVNDGSTDQTAAVLERLSRTWANLKVIHHGSNQGYGAALRSGFRHASKELIFYTDGDGQYDVRELSNLFPLMTEGVDVINGYKIKRSDGRRRKVLGAIYNRLARALFHVPIRDIDCDFRLMRRRALEQIELVSSSGVVCVELIYKLRRAGAIFKEAPVHHYPRLYGESQFFTPSRVARTMFDFLLLWFRLVVLPAFLSPAQTRQPSKAASEKPAASIK